MFGKYNGFVSKARVSACMYFLVSYYVQGRREVGGGPGKFFFQGPLYKKFSGKNFFRRTTSPPPSPRRQLFRSTIFPHEYIAIAFHGLYLNFPCQISVFSPKKPDILSFARKYLTHKKDWGPTKNFQGPPAPRGPR